MTPIGVGPAAGGWALAFFAANVLLIPLAYLALGADLDDDLSTPQFAVVAIAGWTAYLAMVYAVSRWFGTGNVRSDLGVSFRPVDLAGIPLGVAVQVVVSPLVYWPLRQLWPSTFASDEIEERAQRLVDTAGSRWGWLLVVVVVVGAPLVEELVYRGLLQRSVGKAVGAWAGLGLTAAWFALIHFTPIEYPGLFVAGLAFGLGVALFGRVGMGLLAHMAFNATALAILFW